MRMKKMKLRGNGFEPVSQFIAAVLGLVGLIFFLMGFSTGYYMFGQMNSGYVLLLLAVGIVVEFIGGILKGKGMKQFWTLLFSYSGIALLTAAAFLLIGDRVEGIGNCIVTDFDAGHGGEEAIYYSLIASTAMILGVVMNIIGCFSKKAY